MYCMLGRLDYRNLRWEGQLLSGRAQGIGMIIDHNRLFTIAEWNNGIIEGAMCTIYPSRKVFCGLVKAQNIRLGC